MNFNILYLISELPTPIIILIISASIWKSPPAPNDNFGYRTKRSQKSEQAWYFAQIAYGRFSTVISAVVLVITLIVGILSVILNLDETPGLVVFIALNTLVVGSIFATIFAVESKLKKLFDENGAPKNTL